MSSVFDKAVKVAQERSAWEAKVNPSGEPFLLRGFSDSELAESQKHIDAFVDEIVKAANKGAFADATAAKSALGKLEYHTQYMPLWKMAEQFLPINEQTQTLAQALAPARLATVARIRDGKFGVWNDSPEDASRPGVTVHRAVQREGDGEPTRGDAARELQAKRTATQSAAFSEISGAIGATMKTAKAAKAGKPVKAVDEAIKALDKLGGVRMVEGERQVVAAVGQMKLFDEATAPLPKDAAAKKAKPKARK